MSMSIIYKNSGTIFILIVFFPTRLSNVEGIQIQLTKPVLTKKYLIVNIIERDNWNGEKDKYRKKCNQGG